METKYDIGQKVFYVYQEYRGNQVSEGFIKYIKIWSASDIKYGVEKEVGSETAHAEVCEYAIGLTESEAVKSHFIHKAEEQFNQLGDSLSGIKTGKLKGWRSE